MSAKSDADHKLAASGSLPKEETWAMIGLAMSETAATPTSPATTNRIAPIAQPTNARAGGAMEHEHTREAIRKRLAAGPDHSYLRDWIYGGVDGIVTTFAIVSGVVGARLSPSIILILGGASLIADGFAMAAGDYLATRAENEEFQHAEAIERRHIEACPEGEREGVHEILRGYGIADELLEQAVASITTDGDRWVRMMLHEEYGLPATMRSPWRAAVSTFSAFVACGLVPLVPFLAGWREAFWSTCAATGLMFVLIGAIKSRWSTRPWWYSAIETLAIGGGAAAVAYVAGAWLRGLAG
jgi:vacuolar iron transporter family protein